MYQPLARTLATAASILLFSLSGWLTRAGYWRIAASLLSGLVAAAFAFGLDRLELPVPDGPTQRADHQQRQHGPVRRRAVGIERELAEMQRRQVQGFGKHHGLIVVDEWSDKRNITGV